MKQKEITNLITFIVGVVFGLVIGGLTVLNSFDNKEEMRKEQVEELLDVIYHDNPSYYEDVIMETNVYDDIIDWIRFNH